MSTSPQAPPGYGYPPLPGGPAGPQAPADHGTPSAPAPRGRRSLLRARWGFAGALVASVLWTAAVWTVPGLARAPSAALPIGGYRLTDNLCGTAPLSRLGQLYPVSAAASNHFTTRNKALDETNCTEYLKKSATDTEYVSLYLDAQLHHAVNPAPEFQAQRASYAQRQFEVSDVPQLGDQAYAGYQDQQNGTDHNRHFLTQMVYVRDGAMTYYLIWSTSYEEGKETAPDRDGIRQALVIDTRDALRALGGRG
ncbi:hypothetical protein OG455_26625 [Kitasatospora sp. NBC_01287]|uniref:hypothetical protein n=1 Tax=Kitasatospora sp. NBC_01287 TaxID=2903573 RepID=UPI0022580317|nr:hypothetical protein [Kitasatospora sp. NBC_01287]MCX4749039.1 hypothetical protein [Kitasatospora sp. NBC_01287]